MKSITEYEEPELKGPLPLYSLESDSDWQQANKENLIEIKLKNTKIALLVNMIMEILKCINYEKYLKTVVMAKNKTEIIQLLDKSKIVTLFELCEKSTILTDLDSYALLETNSNNSFVFINGHENTTKIYLPLKYIAAERFVCDIHSSLIYELKMLFKQDLMKPAKLRQKDKNKKYLYDGLVSKIEFLEKTDQSVGLPESFSVSDMNDSTSMLKFNDDSMQQFAAQFKASINKEDRDKVNSILNRMTNSQRIRVGYKVAEIKSKNVTTRLNKMKTSIDNVMNEVLSKMSMENLLNPNLEEDSDSLAMLEIRGVEADARLSTIEDYKMFILKQVSNNKKQLQEYYHTQQFKENIYGIMYAKFKQDIIEKETKNKIQRFLRRS